jgi:tetratricopeptide (TPR) repeat protein
VASGQLDLPPPSAVPLVGRERERTILTRALAEARTSKGQTCLIEGAAGIGKTRLVRWLEEEAVRGGFRVLWGYCLKESNLPFFPFQQIFRRSGTDAVAAPSAAPAGAEEELPLLTIFEDERPLRLLERAAALSSSRPCLIISRERPANLRKQLPSLATGARILQLTKSGEGEDCVPPGGVDTIGERLSQHLNSGHGAVVVLTSLDYLISQNGFQPVLRLVQFLREEAERAEAHVMFSVNPATLEKREMALLEGEGEVSRPESAPTAAPMSGPEPPAMTMLRFLETLEREAPHQPRLLVIDDVQWADPDSLRTLQFLARNIRGLPVLMVGTMRAREWRTTEEKEDPVLDDILAKIDEEGSLFRIPLSGLAERESEDLVERTIGLPLQRDEGESENALLSIFRRAEGNPYFVQETMRQLAQEGLLRREGNHAVLVYRSTEEGTADDGAPPIPPTLRRLVARRLSMLTREEMDLLRWAAVAGSEFELPPLVDAMHRPGVEVSALLRRLERDLHLIDAQPGGERWSFGHPLVWEVTLAETDANDRRQKALILADWWAAHKADDIGSVARLYHDAIEPGRGLPWVRKAIDQAISQHASETVERYHRWLQDLLHVAGTSAAGRIQEGLHVCERHLLEIGSGSTLARMSEFLASLPATPAERLPAQILIAYSLSGVSAREAQAQMEIVSAEMDRERGLLPRKWEVIAGLAKVSVLIRQAKYKAAIDETERLSRLVVDVPEIWVKGRVAYSMGHCCASVGQLAKAKEALAEVHRLNEASGSSLLEILSCGLEATIADSEGDLLHAEEGQTRANAAARRQGDMRSTALALTNMVIASGMRGNFDLAKADLSEGRKLCNRFGYRDLQEFLSIGESIVLWGEQRWPELVKQLKDEISRSVGTQAGRAVAQSFLAEAHIECGDLPAARASLERVMQRKEELDQGETANVLRIRARLEEAEGDPATARKTLSEAQQMLEEHPHTYWAACVKAETARWESRHGDAAKAASLRAQAVDLYDSSGVLPAGRPKWLQASA